MKALASIKRLLLQAVLVLLINVTAHVCGAAVDVFWNWMDNPTAAAFPALMAFLLSFWQPWVLLDFLPIMRNYPPIALLLLSVPATLLVYRTLFHLGKLNWVCYLWLRFPPRQKAVAFASFLILGTLSSYVGYKDIPVQHRGIPEIVNENGVQFAAKYALSDSRYYTQDRFVYFHYLWRVRVPQRNVAPLVESLNLKRIPQKSLPADFWQQEPKPIWWQRPSGNPWEAYSDHLYADGLITDTWRDGQFAAYDRQSQTFYYWFRTHDH